MTAVLLILCAWAVLDVTVVGAMAFVASRADRRCTDRDAPNFRVARIDEMSV